MLRQTFTLLATLALALPAGARADREWEEDYTDEWITEDAPVSVDLDDRDSGIEFETFEAPLRSHGTWVSVGAYGRVWRPAVAAGWRPYYYGRWEWTSEGWLWVSDEPFGWAVYHYGRWAHDPYHGWVWVPGYQWAPAWVSWRYSGDVIGWAPLAPGLSVYVTTYPFVDFWWTFVPTVRFVSYPVYSHAYAPHHNRRYWDVSRPAPPRHYRPAPAPGGRPGYRPAPAWGGPAPRFVEERIGRRIDPVRVVSAPRPGVSAPRPGAGEVVLYRPAPRGRGGDATARPERRDGPSRPAFERGDGPSRPTFDGRDDRGGRSAFAPAPGRSSRPERVEPSQPAQPRQEAQREVYRPLPRREESRSTPAFQPRESGGGRGGEAPAFRPESSGGSGRGGNAPAYRPESSGGSGRGGSAPAYRPGSSGGGRGGGGEQGGRGGERGGRDRS
jgi:uncharacterized membrane protein YgcG